jgi:hypothetical protein
MAVMCVSLTLKAVMQNDGDFVEVILLYTSTDIRAIKSRTKGSAGRFIYTGVPPYPLIQYPRPEQNFKNKEINSSYVSKRAPSENGQ